MFYIRSKDYVELLRPAGPLFAFTFPWLVVLIGHQLALCRIIKPMVSLFYLVIVGNILSVFLIAFLVQTFFPKRLSYNHSGIDDTYISKHFKRITYAILIFYMSAQAFQVISLKGFPLLWIILGDSKTYIDYGIHSLNGLLNALYLLSSTCFFLYYLKNKSKVKFLFLLFLLTIPIMLVNRQILISVCLQMSCCYLLYNPKNIKKIVFIGVMILSIFILIGNMRTGLENLVKILQPEPYIPSSLHSLLWVYAYVVTPFNNVNAAFDSIQPAGFPYAELTTLIPYALKDYLSLGGDEINTGFTLVHKNMNVSTFYLSPLLDFGAFYAFTLMCFVQLLLILSYRRALTTKLPYDIIKYSILYMIVILSIFDNLLFALPIVFQLLALPLLRLGLTKKNNIFYLKQYSG
jgi:oligosaccharide repeat unit polymerase